MYSLAYDTTAAQCAVVLKKDNDTLGSYVQYMDFGQAEVLIPQIEKLLQEGKLSFSNLDLVVVCVGPGSFTGVRAGIAAARAGVTGKAVDGAARSVIAAAGYGDYFGHSFGHGVGVEIHEAPNATPGNEKPLPAGAVISAEPGIYLPGRLGVRIEDVIALTEEGCVNLTRAPKALLIL